MNLAQNVSVLTPKTSFLYYGINNPLKIFQCNYSCDHIKLISENKNVEILGENCNYNIKPNINGTIKFKIINNNDSSIIDSFSLKTVIVPDPIFKFHLSGHMDLKLDYIIAENQVWDNFEINYKIIKFELLAKRDTAVIFNETNIGSTYTKNSIQKIGELKKFDKLYLDKIWLEIEGTTIEYTGKTYYKIF